MCDVYKSSSEAQISARMNYGLVGVTIHVQFSRSMNIEVPMGLGAMAQQITTSSSRIPAAGLSSAASAHDKYFYFLFF